MCIVLWPQHWWHMAKIISNLCAFCILWACTLGIIYRRSVPHTGRRQHYKNPCGDKYQNVILLYLFQSLFRSVVDFQQEPWQICTFRPENTEMKRLCYSSLSLKNKWMMDMKSDDNKLLTCIHFVGQWVINKLLGGNDEWTHPPLDICKQIFKHLTTLLHFLQSVI